MNYASYAILMHEHGRRARLARVRRYITLAKYAAAEYFDKLRAESWKLWQ